MLALLNHIRPNVTQQMVDEALSCNFDDFLCYYALFHPDKESVDDVFANLNGLLQDGEWWDLRSQDIPSKYRENVTAVFEKLEPIIHVLRDQKNVCPDSNFSDKHCKHIFDYCDCGNTPISGELAGCPF